MGSLISSSIVKRQEEMQNKMKMERQVQMAMQIARTRDVTLWITTFYTLAAAAMYAGYRKTKNKAVMAPMLPLTFVTCYYWDLAYGNKLHRIRMEAQHILSNEVELLELPTATASKENSIGNASSKCNLRSSQNEPNPRLETGNKDKAKSK